MNEIFRSFVSYNSLYLVKMNKSDKRPKNAFNNHLKGIKYAISVGT